MNELTRLPDPPTPASIGIGHNLPPQPLTPQEVHAYLDDAMAGLLRRRDDLTAAVELFLQRHPTIEAEHVHEAATDNMEMLRKLGIGKSSLAEQRRVSAKAPFLAAERAVDAWFKAFCAGVQAAHARLHAPATAYAERLEAERRAAAKAEAERLAVKAAELARLAEQHAEPDVFDVAIKVAVQADAAARLADARPAEHSRTTTVYGTGSSLREYWRHEVVDPGQVPRDCCEPSDSLLRAKVTADAKAAREAGLSDDAIVAKIAIPGVRIWCERSLQTRSA